MDQEDFSFLADLLRRRSGIALNKQKAHLVDSRLRPVVRHFGFKDVASLMRDLRHNDDTMVRAVIEAMTINDSAFFRNRKTFDNFRDVVLPPLLAERAATKHLRIWCAACAAGQEPYSVAMILEDLDLRAKGWTIDIVATDINSRMIAHAQTGVYSQFEVQRGLSARRLAGNFTQDENNWRINENLRRMVVFRCFNLLDSFGWLEDMDVVFCRNVLMYFDQKTRFSVLDRISDLLASDGMLLIGPEETILPLTDVFASTTSAPGLYSKPKRAPLLRLAVGYE